MRSFFLNKVKKIKIVKSKRKIISPPKDIFVKKEKKIKPKTKLEEVSNSQTIIPFMAITAPTTAYGTGAFVAGEKSSRTGFYFNGHKLFSAFHILSGKTVIPEELIKSISVKPAGFSTQYIDSTGGIVNIKLRNPSSKKITGKFDASLLGLSLFSEGSIAKSG